ncbi:MAG TPA: site-2 protease family protein, partial [bacterium]|nr:site-2 protease family protein [bacterium]
MALLAVVAGVVLFVLLQRRVLIEESLIYIVALIPSIILHEVSHGAAALAFGDDTAKRAGRLTLNPVPHIDPLGTVVLPAVLILTTGTAFGWARPVPVDVGRLRSPRNHSLVVSLVGPGVNIAIALLVALVVRLVTVQGTTAQFLFALGFAN